MWLLKNILMLMEMTIWKQGLVHFLFLLNDLNALCLKHKFHLLSGESNIGHLAVYKACSNLLSHVGLIHA